MHMREFNRTKRWKNLLLLATVAVAAVAAYQAVAVRALAAQPTKVAVVNMDLLMDGLQQGAQDRVALEGMVQQLIKERNEKVEAVDKRADQVKAIADPAQREEEMDQVRLERGYLDIWARESELELKIESALRYVRLHDLITKAIAELVAAEGYDLVLTDDSSDKPIDNNANLPPSLQRAQQLMMRRILYVNPVIDITEELTQRMNNPFKAKPQPQ
jgi:Skp family chaperone for outer membrane proteins